MSQDMQAAPKPVVLMVLDGWGERESPEDNAIAAADTPVWDGLLARHPHTRIATCGEAVGLPEGQMGNSEVGHMNLGAGRIVYQEFTRISKAIEDGEFAGNEILTGAVDAARETDGAVHILGLLSPGGVHSHEDHIAAMARLALERGARAVYVHAFLDGRDTPPKSASDSIKRLGELLADSGRGRIASLCGRYYAMDRDERWERTSRAWNALVRGEAPHRAGDAETALAQAYERDEADEFVEPTLVTPEGSGPALIQDGDAVVFMNFRADRARQLTRCFIEEAFDGFDLGRRPELAAFVTLTRYDKQFDCPVAFPPQSFDNVLGEVLAERGLKQLRLAETEKYAHVTYFFNGGREKPFDGEDRKLIPSPKVATYDLQPEMSAGEVTDTLVNAIGGGRYDVIVCNYANPDMVGHTGDFDAAVRAVEFVDQCLGRAVEAVEAAGGALLVTADHGNVEKMRDPQTGQAHTAHTNGPVPLVYVGPPGMSLADGGALRDIAPTMLELLGIPLPDEMTGRSLLRADADASRKAVP